MKITTKPGKPVRLTRTTYTSAKGGTYDISNLPEHEQKRVLKAPGVDEVKPKPSSSGSEKSKSGGK